MTMSGANIAAIVGGVFMVIVAFLFFSGILKPPANPTLPAPTTQK
jgi:hypothetical protein